MGLIPLVDRHFPERMHHPRLRPVFQADHVFVHGQFAVEKFDHVEAAVVAEFGFRDEADAVAGGHGFADARGLRPPPPPHPRRGEGAVSEAI